MNPIGQKWLAACFLIVPLAGQTLSVTPSSLSFSAAAGASAPASKLVTVTARSRTSFKASATGIANGRTWLSIEPTGNLATNQDITVKVTQSGLTAGTYAGSVVIASSTTKVTVPVSFTVTSPSGLPTGNSFKLIGWNDLGMHCMDGKDYSIFAVLPPYNTIHAHLLDSSGRLLNSDIGYTVTYEGVKDPLTSTINTTSAAKTNFWQYAAALGFGSLAPEMGLKGYAMPVSKPQAMHFSTADNTWLAEGIPVTPYPDSGTAPNYFPMMRLTARNSLNAVVATTDIVTPVSDEMTCSVCHASGALSAAAKPAAGWVNNPDAAKDIKLNILRKHDERFAGPKYLDAATKFGYSSAGLVATTATKPVLCATCHASNALGLPGVTGIPSLTSAMHGAHQDVTDPQTNQTMNSATTRDSCYRCHPGPNTKCLRGAMGALKTASGQNAIECQSCHGNMKSVATSTRNGWLDEPACQSCHTGTALSNNGQLAYTSVFTSGDIQRVAVDQTFATNPNTPASGVSLYRFSKGHGGLQCEACHGSTHAEYTSPLVNDNVQSTALQGHTGMLAECGACHNTVPSTVTGGPHGLHPIGTAWVSQHQSAAEKSGAAQCRACHGLDYRGTILSKMQANRTMAGKTFARGTVIGCYSCHNGPNGD